jgi:tetratricopeptide (TPR) repeat protein
MINIKSITILFLFLTVMGTSILNAASGKPFIIKRDRKRMVVDGLSADEKGNIKYRIRSMSAVMKPSQYIYAHVAIPKEIMEARKKFNSKQYKDAVKAFDKAYKAYKYLGWGSVCIYYSAKSLEALGKTDEAVAKSSLLKEIPKDPEEMPYFMKAKQVEADILVKAKKYEDAKKVLNFLSKGNDKESAMFANNSKGDILCKQGKESEAVFIYLRNIILFDADKSKESLKAIKKTAELLKAQGHPRAKEFEAMK